MQEQEDGIVWILHDTFSVIACCSVGLLEGTDVSFFHLSQTGLIKLEFLDFPAGSAHLMGNVQVPWRYLKFTMATFQSWMAEDVLQSSSQGLPNTPPELLVK